MIALEQVRFSFGAQPLLADVTLAVAPGERCGVIGPNGAGKSTLARLVLGLLRPASGRVLVDGRPVADWPRRELARTLAWVPQDEPIDFPFTALEVALMGRLARLGPLGLESDADVAAAEAALAACDVASLAARPLHTLSGGERQRVLLARALAQEPRAFVLDEPTASLDARHQLALLDLVSARCRDGACALMVLHDFNLAAAYCDRLVLLEAGRPPVAGTPGEILTPERLRAAFGVEVYVGKNALDGNPLVVPTSLQNRKR